METSRNFVPPLPDQRDSSTLAANTLVSGKPEVLKTVQEIAARYSQSPSRHRSHRLRRLTLIRLASFAWPLGALFWMAHGADLTIRDVKFHATAEEWAVEGCHDGLRGLLHRLL